MSNYAIVHKGNEHKRCRVIKYGAQLLRYGKNQIHWVANAEDEKAAILRSGNFCVLHECNWIEGDKLSCICGVCGDDLELEDRDSEDSVYRECSTCND